MTILRTAVICGLITGFVGAFAGCSESKDAKPAGQVVARVNGEELTVHQLNFELANKRLPRDANPDMVSKAVLDSLINQELLIQQANQKELERNPQVLQAIERAKRQVLTQAYLQQVFSTAPDPSDSEVTQYFNENPALFADRKVFQLQEFEFPPTAPIEKIRSQLGKIKNVQGFADWLKQENIPARAQVLTRPAESVPFAFLEKINQLNVGEGTLLENERGAVAVWLAASRKMPMDLEQSKPFIKRFLVKRKREQLAEAEVKRLRENAKIEYLGSFADKAEGGDSTALPESAVEPSEESTPAQ